MNKNVIKFLVIAAILLMTSCLSDVQKRVKQDYGLDKIMCGYAGDKNTAQVVTEEIEARIERVKVIYSSIEPGHLKYNENKVNELRTLYVEIYTLLKSNYITLSKSEDLKTRLLHIERDFENGKL